MQPKRELVAGAASWTGRFLLDLLIPPQCPTCDAIVDEAGHLCPRCFKRAEFIVEPCCRRCGVGFASIGEAGLARQCADCLEKPPAWQRARAAFAYDDFSKQMILPLKYADRTENAGFLARHMARAGAALLQEADLLLPVPLHRWRLFTRRYNQSALLALRIGRLSERPVMVDGLVRTRPTRSLVAFRAEERAAIMAGAIVCRETRRAALQGRRLVLIDDVLTSGSTASACTAALLQAGAASVDILVAARAARPAS